MSSTRKQVGPEYANAGLAKSVVKSRIVHIDFSNGGINAAQKCIRVHRMILDALWQHFGVVERCYYAKNLAFCVLEFSRHFEAMVTLSVLTDERRLQSTIQRLAEQYALGGSVTFVKNVIGTIFSGECVRVEIIHQSKWKLV